MQKINDGQNVCPLCGYKQDSPPREAYHMIPGTVLRGKYLVGRVLGFGGFGVTYVGLDAQLERKIAVKEYLPSSFSTRMPGETVLSVYPGDSEEQFGVGLRQFVAEAQRLAKLQNIQGIVDIYDTFTENGTGYIVMQFLDGQSVKDMINAQGMLPYDTCYEIVTASLKILKEVHKQGIIHRDISPDNIFMTKDNVVKLIDFGAARYATSSNSKSLSVLLKPGYAPPEQYFENGNQGPWTDMYAMAASFYKMLTTVTPLESVSRMNQDTLQEPSKLGATLPKSAENTVMNALVLNIGERTQSADAFLAALESDAPVKRVVPKKTYVNETKPIQPAWLKPVIGGAAAIVLILIALVASGVFSPRALTGSGLSRGMVNAPTAMNKNVENARQEVERLSLRLEISGSDYSDETVRDMVMSQEPMPGRPISTGESIGVFISRGKPIVPNLVNRPLANAAAELSALGFALESREEFSDTAEGVVISQSVSADTELNIGGTVELVVSKGRDPDVVAAEEAADARAEEEASRAAAAAQAQGSAGGAVATAAATTTESLTVTVPDLTGLDFDAEQLISMSAYGFNLVDNSTGDGNYHPDIPLGYIVSQNVPGGTQIDRGGSVLVVRSRGPEAPPVANLNMDAAVQELARAGLRVEQLEEYSPADVTIAAGLVIRQDAPVPDPQNPDGYMITIYVSLGADPRLSMQPGEQEYTVRAGDTLVRIAEMFYGNNNGHLFELIKERNGLVTDAVPIGTFLVIPVLPPEATTTVPTTAAPTTAAPVATTRAPETTTEEPTTRRTTTEAPTTQRRTEPPAAARTEPPEPETQPPTTAAAPVPPTDMAAPTIDAGNIARPGDFDFAAPTLP